MSAEQYIEQDSHGTSGNNELPTYDDLAEQNGPNSRYLKNTGLVGVDVPDNCGLSDSGDGEGG